MRAVIYARYSSDSQREESIEGQLRECMEFANHTGVTVVSNYIDRAMSAKTDNRPEFQRMIKDSYKHCFDMIIVWKLDRFARNRYDSAHYKATLKKKRDEISVSIAKEKIASPIYTQDHFRMGLANYRKIDITKQDGRRKIIDTFINAIFVYDDSLKIVYNGNGKEETISLEELESSTLFSQGAPI